MKKIINEIAGYYDRKITEHGPTSRGVDWKNEFAQSTRLLQFIKFIEEKDKFSILDVGCGYGKLLDLMNSHFADFNYTGIDYSCEQIKVAKSLHAENLKVNFTTELNEDDKRYDYVVASGIFNVMFTDPLIWAAYVKKEMHRLFNLSNKMFACNFLTDYADSHKKADNLFYAKPEEIFEFTVIELSKKLVILHDYELHDFTLIVKK